MSPSSPLLKYRKRVLLFDFDGVLADSFNTFYPLVRDSMDHIGLSLSPRQYRDFFIGNVHLEFKNFISSPDKYAQFTKFRVANYDKYYYARQTAAKLYPGTKKFLKTLSGNYVLAIASSGKLENIKSLLLKNGIAEFFNMVLADSKFSKEDMIKKILSKFKALPEESIFITDTVGDIAIAKKCGLKTIGVSWGFQTKKTLQTSRPDFTAADFNDLASKISLIKS